MKTDYRQIVLAAFVLVSATLLFTASTNAAPTDIPTGDPTTEIVTEIITETETFSAAAEVTNITTTESAIITTTNATITTNATTVNATTAPITNSTDDANVTTAVVTDLTTFITETDNPTTGGGDVTTKAAVTTQGVPTNKPSGKEKSFDAASFIGGMVLAAGVICIGIFGYKFYKSRQDKNYQTF